MNLRTRYRRRLQRGATLTGYALTMATFTAVSLGAIDQLDSGSATYLNETGGQIGTPRAPREFVATSVLEAPPDWAQPTTPPTTVTSTTAAPTSSTSTSSTSTSTSTSMTVASSSSTTVVGPTYTETYTGGIAAVSSGMCLQGNGSQVVQSACDSGADQDVSIQQSSAGGSQIQINGQCVAPSGSSNGNGLVLQACADGNQGQLWDVVGDTLVNRQTGKCMDVPGSSGVDGVQLIQWTCHGNPNQQFPLTDPGPSTPYPGGTEFTNQQVGTWDGLCLRVNGGNGTYTYLFRTSCNNDSSTRRISAVQNPDGSMTLTSVYWGTCFQPSFDNWVDTAPCDGGADQTWIEIPAAGGTVMYQNIATGNCLDMNGPSNYAIQVACNNPSSPGSQALSI